MKSLEFTIETFIELKKTNYLINFQRFRGQPVLKKAKFVSFGIEKAKLGNPDLGCTRMVNRMQVELGQQSQHYTCPIILFPFLVSLIL